MRGLAAKLVLFAAAIVGVLLLPQFLGDFQANRFATIGAYFIAIVGLNILVGYSGQISLAHGAFMAVGGYTTAILMTDHGVRDIVTIPVAGVVAGIAGLALGLPALRLSGLYLAIATFGIAVSLPSILKKFDGFTGGSTGIQLFGRPEQTGHGIGVTVFGHQLSNNDWLYYLTWTVGLLLFAAAWALMAGRVGRSLLAIRDSEVAAASAGVYPAFYKVLAFGISAAFAGVAGALYSINTAYVNPDTFPIPLSLYLLVGVVVGGLGYLWGAALGAAFIVYVPIWAQSSALPGWLTSKQAPQVVFGVAIILLMLLVPTGLAGLLTRWRRPSSFKEVQ
jgi:branched-chain amino acid transport system permease protein